MTDIALRPFSTSLIKATIDAGGRTLEFHAVDPDTIARFAFHEIDTMNTELRPVIAARLVEALATWVGEPGTEEELQQAKEALTKQLSESLASAYERAVPRREAPAPPVINATATPLPNPSTVAEARKWVLTWETLSLDPYDSVRADLIAEPVERAGDVEATAFERALLAFHIAPDEETLSVLATTPIEIRSPLAASIPTGPASGTAVFDAGEAMGVRAVVVRNDGFPDAFVYTAEGSSEIFQPTIERKEELGVTSLDEIAALAPSRVEVRCGNVPVLIAGDPFDAGAVRERIDEWRRERETPPDAEIIFDITAACLRLRRVVWR